MSDSTDLSKQFAGQYAVVTGGTQGMGELLSSPAALFTITVGMPNASA